MVLNFADAIRSNPSFRKLEFGDLLFAQYTCPLREPSVSVWAGMDHLIHVLSGKKTWQTNAGSWPVVAGETIFFRKGAYVLRQSFSADFCVLLFFIPDGFVRDVVRELGGELGGMPEARDVGEMAIRIRHDICLNGFLQSMAAYFTTDESPPEAMLRLKLRELITGILLGRRNRALACYFRALAAADAPSLPNIMEANFTHNLPLNVFAQMSHRSLSAFKRDFRECYSTSPGRWLRARRLERAAVLLRTTNLSITQVVYECGFESAAHFSRAFRSFCGKSPRDFRTERALSS